MTHPRSAIRAAVKAQLVARASLTALVPAERVFLSRYRDLFAEKQLPAIRIYTHSEETDEDSWTSAPREYYRRLDCVIEGAIRVPSSKSDQLDDMLDDLAWEIEKALGKDDTLNDTASDSNLARTAVEVDTDSEQVVGQITLVFRIDYTSHPGQETAELDDLDTVSTAWNLSGTQAPADRASDTITGLYDP